MFTPRCPLKTSASNFWKVSKVVVFLYIYVLQSLFVCMLCYVERRGSSTENTTETKQLQLLPCILASLVTGVQSRNIGISIHLIQCGSVPRLCVWNASFGSLNLQCGTFVSPFRQSVATVTPPFQLRQTNRCRFNVKRIAAVAAPQIPDLNTTIYLAAIGWISIVWTSLARI